MKTMSLRLTEPLAAKLASVARRRGQTKSALVRRVLEDYLQNGGDQQPGACLALAADLVGCVRGPEDLSFNKKHLRGLGR